MASDILLCYGLFSHLDRADLVATNASMILLFHQWLLALVAREIVSNRFFENLLYAFHRYMLGISRDMHAYKHDFISKWRFNAPASPVSLESNIYRG